MIKLSDIAEAMNVSEATISNAITGKGRMKEETRQEILQKAEELGYKRREKRPEIRRKIVVVCEETGASTEAILRGLLDEAWKEKQYLPIYRLAAGVTKNGRKFSADQMRHMLIELLKNVPYPPDGLIYISTNERKVNGLFEKLGLPAVAVGLVDSGATVHVNSDYQQEMFDAISRLRAAGKEKISVFMSVSETWSNDERMKGYTRAVNEETAANSCKIWIGNWKRSSVYELTLKVLSGKNPTDAVLVQDAAWAEGVMKAAQKLNIKVPEQLAVIGLEQAAGGTISPGVMCMTADERALGETAIKAMNAILRKQNMEKRNLLVKSRLLMGESV